MRNLVKTLGEQCEFTAEQELHMICAAPNGIGSPHAWTVGGFPSMVMPHDYFGTVLPRPAHGAGTRRRVNVFGIKRRAWPKQRVESADLPEHCSPKGHICTLYKSSHDK